jgi:hypothetical protein
LVAQAFVGLEIAVRRRAAGMDDTLRNALVVKVGDFFAQDKSSSSVGPRLPARSEF